MRLISQEERVIFADLPYEGTTLYIEPGEPCTICGSFSGIVYVLAVYSTQEKAQKAMQMLHECYTGMLYMRNVDFGKDVDVKERLKESLTHGIGFISVFDTEENVKIKPMNIVFRFPKEDEV